MTRRTCDTLFRAQKRSAKFTWPQKWFQKSRSPRSISRRDSPKSACRCRSCQACQSVPNIGAISSSCMSYGATTWCTSYHHTRITRGEMPLEIAAEKQGETVGIILREANRDVKQSIMADHMRHDGNSLMGHDTLLVRPGTGQEITRQRSKPLQTVHET